MSNTASNITSRLSIFYLAYFMVIGAFMPYWNAYLEDIGYSKAIIGALGVIPVLTRIIAPLLWGHISDKTQQRMGLVRIAALMQLIAWLALMSVVDNLVLLVVFLFIYSFFQNAILSQFEAVALYWLDYHPKRYGAVRLWGSIGFIVAATGLGFWFDWFSIEQLPYWLLFFSLIAVWFSFVVPNPPKREREKTTENISKVLKQKPVILFFSLEFLLLLSHAPFYTFYSNYLAQYQYTSTWIGLLWGIGVLAEVIMFKFGSHLLTRFTPSFLMIACLLITAFRWFLIAYYPQILWIQIFAQTLHAFSFGLFQILAMRFLHQYFNGSQQGRAQGLFSMTWGIAVGVGGVIAGYVWNIISGPSVFMIAAVICVIAAILATVGFKRLDLYRLEKHSLLNEL